MPLRDHFRPPVWTKSSWEGFHGMWPAGIVIQLNKHLPDAYTAEPRVHLGTYFEIDVCAYEDDEPKSKSFRSLVVGRSLPTLPLWLTEDLPISLDLEPSYEETCRALRIA